MQRALAKRTEYVDFPSEIKEFLARVQQYVRLYSSPKRTEFEFCGLLAAWETTVVQNSRSCRWFEIWQKHCLKHHHGKAGLTLADPVDRPILSKRWQVGADETGKAYKSVLGGLRRVFKATLAKYDLKGTDHHTAADGPWVVLWQLIDQSFKTAEGFACPVGLESFLLTLIQVFERLISGDKDKLVSREQWQAELQRKRSLGPAATRTLADVAPAAERLRRHQSFPEAERVVILRSMLPPMRRIETELQSYLSKRASRPGALTPVR